MLYSITCFNKILTSAIALFLFILFEVLSGFAMVPGVHILLSSQEEDVYYFSWGTLYDIMLLCQSCRWIGKNTNKEFSCVMVLIVRPSSILKFQFVFGLNECLWALFSLLNFKKFLFYIWVGFGSMTSDFTTQMTSTLTLCQWIKSWVQRQPNISQNVVKDL